MFLVKANIYINGVALLTLYTLEKFLHKNCKVQISNIENSVNPFEGKAILLKRGFKYQTSTQQQPTQKNALECPYMDVGGWGVDFVKKKMELSRFGHPEVIL